MVSAAIKEFLGNESRPSKSLASREPLEIWGRREKAAAFRFPDSGGGLSEPWKPVDSEAQEKIEAAMRECIDPGRAEQSSRTFASGQQAQMFVLRWEFGERAVSPSGPKLGIKRASSFSTESIRVTVTEIRSGVARSEVEENERTNERATLEKGMKPTIRWRTYKQKIPTLTWRLRNIRARVQAQADHGKLKLFDGDLSMKDPDGDRVSKSQQESRPIQREPELSENGGCWRPELWAVVGMKSVYHNRRKSSFFSVARKSLGTTRFPRIDDQDLPMIDSDGQKP
ncbi:hypothetical protein R3P38DRAFT_2778009 [Favolaschia claudopus]|uniref:Uncharacterized protein n=1 Tax=Favolaschia claudopus TaxID=2862362 RepID=A0AAW0BJL8_9AGAR